MAFLFYLNLYDMYIALLMVLSIENRSFYVEKIQFIRITCLNKSLPGRHSTVTVDEQSIGRGTNTPNPFCISDGHGFEIYTEQLSLSLLKFDEKLTRTAYFFVIVLLSFVQQSSPEWI